MRCPHCRGEIPPVSRFCGVCGRNVTIPPTESAPRMPGASGQRSEDPSPSLFELPVSRGARITRIAMILFLDFLLLGGGVALTVAYFNKRAAATEAGKQNSPADRVTSEAPAAKAAEKTLGAENGDSSANLKPTSREAAKGVSAPSKERPTPGDKASAGPSIEAASAKGPAEPDSANAPAEPDSTKAPVVPDISKSDPAKPAPVEPPLDSSLSEEEKVKVLAAKLELLVRRSQNHLERCYQRATKAERPDQPLTGRIDVQFSVFPDGKARQVRAIANTTGSQQLANCLVGLVDTWTFPSSGTTPLDFVWPFEFKAS